MHNFISWLKANALGLVVLFSLGINYMVFKSGLVFGLNLKFLFFILHLMIAVGIMISLRDEAYLNSGIVYSVLLGVFMSIEVRMLTSVGDVLPCDKLIISAMGGLLLGIVFLIPYMLSYDAMHEDRGDAAEQ